jgi:Zn-dependent protease with chaperone function
MPLLLLFYLILTALPLPWAQPRFGLGPLGSAGLTAALMLLPVLLAWLIGERTARRLRIDPHSRGEIVRRYNRGKSFQLYAMMAMHLLALAVGWGWAAEWIGGVGTEFLRMAPFLLALGLSWAVCYPADRLIHEPPGDPDGASRHGPFYSRAGYVVFMARQRLAFVGVPLALFLIQQALLRSVPDLFVGWNLVAVMVGIVALAVALAPLGLRLMLGLRPLPPGPLRDRLSASGRRLKVRYADILLWDTRGAVANAMLAGVLPRLRYILLSDRLLAELTPDELEAVFGHEVGHVKHRHMAFYLLFFFMSLVALAGFWNAASDAILGPQPTVPDPTNATWTWRDWEAVPALVLAGVYIFVAFGFVSRRCERQADLYGCRVVSCGRPDCDGHLESREYERREEAYPRRDPCPTGIRIFVNALEKVAISNGISRDRPGRLHTWLHGSIAQRVDFLEGVMTDRVMARDFQRRVSLLKWGLVAGLTAALVGLQMTGYGGRVWAGM